MPAASDVPRQYHYIWLRYFADINLSSSAPLDVTAQPTRYNDNSAEQILSIIIELMKRR